MVLVAGGMMSDDVFGLQPNNEDMCLVRKVVGHSLFSVLFSPLSLFCVIFVSAFMPKISVWCVNGGGQCGCWE